MKFMKKYGKLVLCSALLSVCCSFTAAQAAPVTENPAGSGVYNANAVGDYTLTPDTINSLTASNSANVVKEGDLTIKGKTNAYSLYAGNKASVTVNGNLTANFGAGTSGGYSGVLAVSGGKIILNGKENMVISDSTQYKNSKSAFQTGGVGSEIIVNSDLTTITYNPKAIDYGFFAVPGGANSAIRSGDGGRIVFQNGKQGAESSLVKIEGNSSSQRHISATLNSSASPGATDKTAHKYANDGQYLEAVATEVILDRVQIDNKSGYTRSIFTQGNGARISLLSADINRDGSYGAAAVESTIGGLIEVRGYEGGALNIGLAAGGEAALRAQGGTVNVNTSQSAGFVTDINSKNTANWSHGEIGISSGTLGAAVDNGAGGKDIVDTSVVNNSKNAGAYGSKYANSDITVYGTTKINMGTEKNLALRVMGDGSSIALKAVAGQARSSIVNGTTAVRFAYANGYSVDRGAENNLKQKIVTGGQVITLEQADVSGDGMEFLGTEGGDMSGNLVQVGAHGVVAKKDGYNLSIMQVQDAVKGATLNLTDSTLKLKEGVNKDIINVTYGEMTDADITAAGTNTIATVGKVSSELTVNANKTTMTGSMFADYTKDRDAKSSILNLNMTNASVWDITKEASMENEWLGAKVKGNFVTNITNDNSTINNVHSATSEFKNLYVEDTYTGKGGKIVFNTVFADDAAKTDKLIAKNTAGTTDVYFNNIGGMGAQTNIGIEVIQVLDKSDGVFNQAQSRLVYGAYDYAFIKGGNGGDAKNWYLVSKPAAIRPEIGAYVANRASAWGMFDLRLHDRLGELPLNQKNNNEAEPWWGRVVMSEGHNHFSDKALTSDNKMQVIQVGKNLNQSTRNNHDDRYQWGVMATYATASNRLKSAVVADTAKGDVSGVLLGLYGTWYQNEDHMNGWYADSWLQYGWFNNTVRGSKIASESYHYNGVAASLELGRTIKLNKNDSDKYAAKYYLQPQGQIIWGSLNGLSHQESNGTVVSSHGDNTLQSRLGVKLLRTQLNQNNKSNQVYISTYWLHNNSEFKMQANDVQLNTIGSKNIWEVKAGVDMQMNKKMGFMELYCLPKG